MPGRSIRGSALTALKNAFNLTSMPKPGPTATVEFGFYNPSFEVLVTNVDVRGDVDTGVVLDWNRKPVVMLSFNAAPGTYYVAECFTIPLKMPSTLDYTLEWTSDAQTESTPGPQSALLRSDPVTNGQWISAVIPKQPWSRHISIRAMGFTSSRILRLCQLTPFK